MNGMARTRRWAAPLALGLLLVVAGQARPARAGDDPQPICGDVNGNLVVTSSDALLTLRKAVNQPIALQCTECPALFPYGAYEPLDQTDATVSEGYLIGNLVTFDQAVTVSRFGLNAPAGGSRVRMALYKDEGGLPGALVVGTPVVALAKGSQEIPVAIKPVAAGTYWLMVVYDTTTSIRWLSGVDTPTVMYRSFAIDDPLPDPFGPADSYTGTMFNHWVKVLP